MHITSNQLHPQHRSSLSPTTDADPLHTTGRRRCARLRGWRRRRASRLLSYSQLRRHAVSTGWSPALTRVSSGAVGSRTTAITIIGARGEPGRRDSALRRGTGAVAANPLRVPSVKYLAAQTALSSPPSRLFHPESGTTPARYVLMVRVDAARVALDGRATVSAETARLAGLGPRKPSGGASQQGPPGPIPRCRKMSALLMIPHVPHPM